MKALVTGGTGVVGQVVVTELLRRGHSVREETLNDDQAELIDEWVKDLIMERKRSSAAV